MDGGGRSRSGEIQIGSGVRRGTLETDVGSRVSHVGVFRHVHAALAVQRTGRRDIQLVSDVGVEVVIGARQVGVVLGRRILGDILGRIRISFDDIRRLSRLSLIGDGTVLLVVGILV